MIKEWVDEILNELAKILKDNGFENVVKSPRYRFENPPYTLLIPENISFEVITIDGTLDCSVNITIYYIDYINLTDSTSLENKYHEMLQKSLELADILAGNWTLNGKAETVFVDRCEPNIMEIKDYRVFAVTCKITVHKCFET